MATRSFATTGIFFRYSLPKKFQSRMSSFWCHMALRTLECTLPLRGDWFDKQCSAACAACYKSAFTPTWIQLPHLAELLRHACYQHTSLMALLQLCKGDSAWGSQLYQNGVTPLSPRHLQRHNMVPWITLFVFTAPLSLHRKVLS